MRRTILLPALIVLLAPAAAGAEPALRPPAKVLLTACEQSVDAEERRAVFEGRMRRVAGAERLQMRFSLKQRAPLGSRWSGVQAEGWGSWMESDPGVTEYRYTREVVYLAAPAAYRTVVRFRWLDAGGDVVARTRVRSRTCRQPDLRPDLEVHSIAIRRADDPGERRYLVAVHNDGRTRTAGTALELSVDGGEPLAVAVPPLGADRTRVVELLGARCAPGAGGISALADAYAEVDEVSEANNRLARPCVA